MSSFLLAVLFLSAPPSEGTDSANSPSTAQTAEAAKAAPLAGRELEQAIREALRRWNRPTDKEADAAARDFLGLYENLRKDAKLGQATREELRNKTRFRLAQLSEQIAKRVAREQRKAKGPKRLETPMDKDPNLAQFGPAMPGRGLGPGFGGPGMGAGVPGMGAGAGGWAGQGGAEADNGQALVDLIQRTIAPSSWDVNGGPGSIYYWYPGKALVIRASQEVHEQIGGALEQLERANR